MIIKPVLESMGYYSVAAENLLLGTALQESGLRYLKQLGGGPALGVYQMEPATHQDIWINYLNAREDLKYKVLEWHEESMIDDPVNAEEVTRQPSAMTWNLAYATAMARVHYLRVPEPLPEAHNVMDMAEYWKAHFNTPRGAGTPEEYVANYVAGRGE